MKTELARNGKRGKVKKEGKKEREGQKEGVEGERLAPDSTLGAWGDERNGGGCETVNRENLQDQKGERESKSKDVGNPGTACQFARLNTWLI